MENDILESAVEAAKQQLRGLRLQLSSIDSKHIQLEEISKRLDEELVSINEVEGSIESSIVNDYSSKGSSETWEAIHDSVLQSIGRSGMLGTSSISNALHGLVLNHSLDRLVGSDEVDTVFEKEQQQSKSESHPIRATIFGGDYAGYFMQLNISETTTFGELRDAVCDVWLVSPFNYRLEANTQTGINGYKPLEFRDDEHVAVVMKELKSDKARGNGCNGMTSEYVLSPTLLPPLYLVYNELVKRSRLGSQESLLFEDRKKRKTKAQLVERLFQNHMDDQELLSFRGLQLLLRDYYGANQFFERYLLVKLFAEHSTLSSLSEAAGGYGKINLPSVQNIMETLDATRNHKTSKPNETTAVEPRQESVEEESPSCGPERVFSWMLGVNKEEGTGIDSVAEEGGDLTFEQFSAALDECVPVDSPIKLNWWSTSFMASHGDRVTLMAFTEGWPLLGLMELSGGDNTSSDEGESVFLKDVIERAVIRHFEQNVIGEAVSGAVDYGDGISEPSLMEGSLRNGNASKPVYLSFHGMVYSSLMTFILFVLGLTISVLVVDIRSGSGTSVAFSRQLLKPEFYCTAANRTYNIYALGTQITFNEMYSVGCLYGFLSGPMFDMYYSDFLSRFYEDVVGPGENGSHHMLSYYKTVPEHVLIRNLMVKNTSCDSNLANQASFLGEIGCFGPYSEENRRTEDLNNSILMNAVPEEFQSALIWQTFPDLQPVIGHYATYDASGYAYKLGEIQRNPGQDENVNVGQSALKWVLDLVELQKMAWVNMMTRAIIVNLGLYNPNTAMYSNVEILFEINTEALMRMSTIVRSFPTNTEPGSSFHTALILRLVVAGLILFLLVYEIWVVYRDTRARDEQAGRPRPRGAVNMFLRILKVSSVLLTVLCLIFAIVSITKAFDFKNNPQIIDFDNEFPDSDWNARLAYDAYQSMQIADVVSWAFIVVKLLGWLHLFPSLSPVLKVFGVARFVFLACLAVYFMLMSVLGLCIVCSYYGHFIDVVPRTVFLELSTHFRFTYTSLDPHQSFVIPMILVLYNLFVRILIGSILIGTAYFYFFFGENVARMTSRYDRSLLSLCRRQG